ncbi:carboxypeptidase-like regulatory domain-containing protein [Lutibacter maritimus]|uniref:CarboxypepD_reg-like domain-containing protein n=1 Tax=Lutibacter maritimus TaxID=593133 RepID=A0A1I6R4V1_9FLAO|nr:carboxypeptidase-like regulatory domain-containing protein [Lutibacter maritimus]SFS59580.1 CarboxypepD_reg-like domain-containing protein [Lutibacter maritimus]
MKSLSTIFGSKKTTITAVLLIIFTFVFNNNVSAKTIVKDTIGFKQFEGVVIDSKTKKELVYASITVNGTNISTVTNSQGDFTIKVPTIYLNNKITVSYLGYTSLIIDLKNLEEKNNIIKLETYIEELSEVKIEVKDAKSLVLEMLKRRGQNYFTEQTTMTGFYRETIKKRRSYVSLSEAVVEIYKQSYTNSKNDILKLYKARKSTDYDKLDTITLKLQGGPFSALYMDIIKNPNLFFSEEGTDSYDFHFDTATKIDNKPVYVVSFAPKSYIEEPLYIGKLYIEAKSLALKSATFQLSLEDTEKAARLFIVKKPSRADVIPIQANYHVDYREKDGEWFYGYSRIELGFKIDYDKRLFNSVYYLTMEMAITDWEKNEENLSLKFKDRFKSNAILSDEASGFSDPEFWGEFNVIEPEKPIESAIKKIQKQLKKSN